MLKTPLYTAVLLAFSTPANAIDDLLDLSLFELQNVEVVTAGKTRQKVKDIPASVVIVTRKDIERYGYTTLTEILENTPGLYNIFSYNGMSGNFGLRGFYSPVTQNNNIVLLVNGIKQTNDDTRSNPMAKVTVPVEAIDRIEVIRGPMAVIYGSGASFGAINIITNEITADNNVSLVSVTAGSRDAGKAALRISRKTADLKLVINASIYEADGPDYKFKEFITPQKQALLPFFGVTDPNYSTKNLLDHNNRYFGVSGSYKKTYFDLAYNETDVELYAVAPSLVHGIQQNTLSTNMMVGYADDINDWITLDGRLIYSDHDNDFDVDILDPSLPGQRGASYESWEVELLSTLKPHQRWDVIAGFNQRTMTNYKERIHIPAAGIINQLFERNDRTTRSVFGQATYRWSEQLTFVAGLRWEDHLGYKRSGIDNIGTPGELSYSSKVEGESNLLPRVAVLYHFDNRNTVKLLYGEAKKLVDDDTNNPESTKTAEINFIHSRPGLNISTSLFHNELDDLFIEDIVLGPDGGLGFATSRAGKVTTTGIEFTAKGGLTNNLQGEFSVTLQESKDKHNDIDAAYSPRAVAHAKISYDHENSTYSLLGRYVGSMKSGFDITKENPDGSFGRRVGEDVDAYIVMDANYRQEHILGNGYFNLSITNVFNEEIRYANNLEFTELLDRGTIGYERAVVGTIGWRF